MLKAYIYDYKLKAYNIKLKSILQKYCLKTKGH